MGAQSIARTKRLLAEAAARGRRRYWHGTSTERLDTILREGLDPAPDARRRDYDIVDRDGPPNAPIEGAYMIRSGRRARQIAENAAEDLGGRPAVVGARIDPLAAGGAIDDDLITTAARNVTNRWIDDDFPPQVTGADRPTIAALGYMLAAREAERTDLGSAFIRRIRERLGLSGDLQLDPYGDAGRLADRVARAALASFAKDRARRRPPEETADFQAGVLATMDLSPEDLQRGSDRQRRNVRSVVDRAASSWPLDGTDTDQAWQNMVDRLGRLWRDQTPEEATKDSIRLPDGLAPQAIAVAVEVRDGGDALAFHKGRLSRDVAEALGVPDAELVDADAGR